jgi:spermidine/putrescine transport system substrate-binding protein
MTPLATGEIAVAHVYMSDALQARKQTHGKIEYILPEEGGTFWLDNLVIPATASHVKEAHQFINFLLEGKTVVSTVTSVFVAPTNMNALSLLPKELASDPALFPSDAMLAKCEMIEDLGETLAVWDRIWTEVKAEKN